MEDKMIHTSRPPGKEKIKKATALYIYKGLKKYNCDECAFWRNERCALFGPSVPIKSYGTCGLWLEKNDLTPTAPWFVNVINKKEAGYDENPAGFSCKRCEYFLNP